MRTKKFYAHEEPDFKGKQWVNVLCKLKDGRYLRASYHPNGKIYANGSDIKDRVEWWKFD